MNLNSNNNLNEQTLQEIYEITVLGSISMIWYNSEYLSNNYTHHVDIFIEIIEKFCNGDKIKLAKGGKFLTNPVMFQLQKIKDSLPSQERMQDESYWWYLDDCPAGVVWIIDEAIEGFTTPAENGKHYFWT